MKPPGPDDWTVIFWLVVIVLVGCGVVCFAYALRAPAEKVEEATRLMWHGLKCFAAALGLWAIRRFCCGYR
jgi:hypothetical protein